MQRYLMNHRFFFNCSILVISLCVFSSCQSLVSDNALALGVAPTLFERTYLADVSATSVVVLVEYSDTTRTHSVYVLPDLQSRRQ